MKQFQDIAMVQVNAAKKEEDEEEHIVILNVDFNSESKSDLPNTKAAVKLMKGFCLGIAYAASIGGAGSLVGTTPNLLLKGYFDEKYPEGGLNFLTYMAFSCPVSIIMVFFTWIIMCVIWLPRKYSKTFSSDFLLLILNF